MPCSKYAVVLLTVGRVYSVLAQHSVDPNQIRLMSDQELRDQLAQLQPQYDQLEAEYKQVKRRYDELIARIRTGKAGKEVMSELEQISKQMTQLVKVWGPIRQDIWFINHELQRRASIPPENKEWDQLWPTMLEAYRTG
ncbi:MAG: hypothetical protein QHH07_12890 [Sedimentisphaerales bacterium]|nr:hypothetical protein [Sedimentisphaerales bacterium]